MEIFCEHLDTLSNTVGNFSSKVNQFESSLVVTKTVNDNLLNCITSLERSLRAQEWYSKKVSYQICDTWFHKKCTQFSEKDFKLISFNNCNYFCQSCFGKHVSFFMLMDLQRTIKI